MKKEDIKYYESQIKTISTAHTEAGRVAVKNPTDYNVANYQILDNRLK